MPKVTARTPLALIAAYGDNVEIFQGKLNNLHMTIWSAPDLCSVTEWRKLLGLDDTLPEPDTDTLIVAPHPSLPYIARNMEHINQRRRDNEMSTIFTEQEIKDVLFAAGGSPAHVRRDMLQLLQKHAPDPENLINQLRAITQITGMNLCVKELRLMTGLDESAPPVALRPEETGTPAKRPSVSIAHLMITINSDCKKGKVFSHAEILTALEWEHDL